MSLTKKQQLWLMEKAQNRANKAIERQTRRRATQVSSRAARREAERNGKTEDRS